MFCVVAFHGFRLALAVDIVMFVDALLAQSRTLMYYVYDKRTWCTCDGGDDGYGRHWPLA